MAGRRFLFYFAWSWPQETQMDLATLDNRFATMTEVRRQFWPTVQDLYDYSGPLGIDGVLDRILQWHQGCATFIDPGNTGLTRVVERQNRSLACRYLYDLNANEVDTLVVMSFDHVATGQAPTAEEVQWARDFLSDEKKCLVVCPHHDIGASGRYLAQQAEFSHHGDSLTPPQDRIGGFAQALLRALDFPIANQFGLKAAVNKGQPADLDLGKGLDSKGVLKDVRTFTDHAHLPHFEVPANIQNRVRVLARQAIDVASGSATRAEHPFLNDPGHDKLNALLQLDGFPGTFLVSDVTLWLKMGARGEDSLQPFWRNMASL